MEFERRFNTITICPSVFNENYLFGTVGEALNSNLIHAPGQILEHVAPRTIALFHEMIHLADVGRTEDVACTRNLSPRAQRQR